MEVGTQEDGFPHLPKLGERGIGWMLNVAPCEAPQDRFCIRRPQAQGRGVLDHLIIVLLDEIPLDGPRAQHRLQERVGLIRSYVWAPEGLLMDTLEPRQELKH